MTPKQTRITKELRELAVETKDGYGCIPSALRAFASAIKSGTTEKLSIMINLHED